MTATEYQAEGVDWETICKAHTPPSIRSHWISSTNPVERDIRRRVRKCRQAITLLLLLLLLHMNSFYRDKGFGQLPKILGCILPMFYTAQR
jgi:hypothetical protein